VPYFKAKNALNSISAGVPPETPLGSLHCSVPLDPLLHLNGHISKGQEGKGKGKVGKAREKKYKEKVGKGERKGKVNSPERKLWLWSYMEL